MQRALAISQLMRVVVCVVVFVGCGQPSTDEIKSGLSNNSGTRSGIRQIQIKSVASGTILSATKKFNGGNTATTSAQPNML